MCCNKLYGLILFFTASHTDCRNTCSQSSLLEGDTCLSTVCQKALRLTGWQTVARPAVRYGPVRLALTPAHLPELTLSLPHHLSRRTKCAVVLAKLPEMSTWRDKPMPAPWPSQAWYCGALPWIRREARNMPRLQQPLIDYRGATILSGVDRACSVD